MTTTVHHVQHPLVEDSLTVIRDRETPNAAFRTHLSRIATIVLTEATRDLTTEPVSTTTPLSETVTRRLTAQPVIVPVLRAGLGFVNAAQELLPDADIGFIGMARNEESFAPEPYVTRLPADLNGRPIIVVDPMLATGGSLIAALELIRSRHDSTPSVTVACALAAPEGIDRVASADVDLEIDLYVAAIDERLNEHAFIVPGLGDAGDRLFGLGS